MPDPQDDDAWVRALLSSHADSHALDLESLQARLAEEIGRPATGTPATGTPATAGTSTGTDVSTDVSTDVGTDVGTDIGTDVGTDVGAAVPPTTARPALLRPPTGRRRLLPVVLAAAVIAAITGVVAAVPRGTDRQGGGSVQVEGVSPAARPGGGSGSSQPAGGPTTVGSATTAPSAGSSPLSSAGAHAGAGRTGPPSAATLPSSFRWTSSGILVEPRPDAQHQVTGVKDPSVVYFGGKWHVFATARTGTGEYGLVYLSFTDWSQAKAATPYYLDRSPIGTGYRAAPQVFWFAPQKLWYLVYQDGGAAYSTNPDISNPAGWTAPEPFYSGTPAIVTRNIGSGFWVDMWVICDATTCHLFSSDDNGHLYRSQTSLAAFPHGMSDPVIAKQETVAGDLFEASSVYRIDGTNTYLLLVEAFGPSTHRYFRSWTSTDPAGPWTPLADHENSPFVGTTNVTFAGGPWTQELGQGEVLRAGRDQTMTIARCGLRYLYQGLAPVKGDDNAWRLGLLTQTGGC